MYNAISESVPSASSRRGPCDPCPSPYSCSGRACWGGAVGCVMHHDRVDRVVVQPLRLDQVDEIVEDGKLELKFDTVDHTLKCNLESVLVGELDAQKRDVHGDDDKVNGQELVHQLALTGFGEERKEFDNGKDVEAGNNKLLDAETAHLDALHDTVADDEDAVAVTLHVGTEREEGCREVQQHDVDADHDQDVAQHFLVVQHQMEPRVEYQGLAGDHKVPADGEHPERQPNITKLKKLDQKSDRVKSNANSGRHEHAPEIQSLVFLEDAEDDDDDLNSIVTCDRDEHSEESSLAEVLAGVFITARQALAVQGGRGSCAVARHDCRKKFGSVLHSTPYKDIEER